MGQKKQKKRFFTKDPTKNNAATIKPKDDMMIVVVSVKSTNTWEVSPVNNGNMIRPGQIWQNGVPIPSESKGRPKNEFFIARGIKMSKNNMIYLIDFSLLKLNSS